VWSEDKSGSIATFVVNAPVGDDLSVGSGGEETESSGGLATGPEESFFCVYCNSATAAARLTGQSEFLIWTGE
jgi:hypothetical protein